MESTTPAKTAIWVCYRGLVSWNLYSELNMAALAPPAVNITAVVGTEAPQEEEVGVGHARIEADLAAFNPVVLDLELGLPLQRQRYVILESWVL